MPDEPSPRPGCPNPHKVDYRGGEAGARRVARAIARETVRKREHFATLYGYLCPCGGYHMTHSPIGPRGQANVELYSIDERLQAFALERPAE